MRPLSRTATRRPSDHAPIATPRTAETADVLARFGTDHELVLHDGPPSCSCDEWSADEEPVGHSEHVLRTAATDPTVAPALARSLLTSQLTRELARRPDGVRAMLETLVELEALGFPNAAPIPLGDGMLRQAWVADRTPDAR